LSDILSMEAYMSSEASLALSTDPLMNNVASATSGSETARLRSCKSSTSARETLRSSSKNRATRSTFSLAYRSSASVTGMLRPLISMSTSLLPSVVASTSAGQHFSLSAVWRSELRS
jgi:hypothetical protein